MEETVPRRLVGWREHVDAPDWGIHGLRAKVDTGARTSAVHAIDLQIDDEVATFRVRIARAELPATQAEVAAAATDEVVVSAPIVEYRDIKDSGGHVTNRPIVKTRLDIAGVVQLVEVSLARREQMGFEMLVGREALRDAFVVDPTLSFVAPEGHAVRSLRPWSHEEFAARQARSD